MTYSLQVYGDQRIIVGVLGEEFDLGADIEPYVHELGDLLDGMNGPAVYVNDLGSFNLNFADMIGLMASVTRGNLAVMKHPNLLMTIVISTNNMVRLGVNALAQNQYGSLRTEVVPTFQDALAHAARELAQVH